MGLSGGSVVQNPPTNARDLGLNLGWEDPLEKQTATHSSILAWKIPWTSEPGRSQSVRHGVTEHAHNRKNSFLIVSPISIGCQKRNCPSSFLEWLCRQG